MAERLRLQLEAKQQLMRERLPELRSSRSPRGRNSPLRSPASRRCPGAPPRPASSARRKRLESLIARTLKLVSLERPRARALAGAPRCSWTAAHHRRGCGLSSDAASFLVTAGAGPVAGSGDPELLRSAFENVYPQCSGVTARRDALVGITAHRLRREHAGAWSEVCHPRSWARRAGEELGSFQSSSNRRGMLLRTRQSAGEGLGLGVSACTRGALSRRWHRSAQPRVRWPPPPPWFFSPVRIALPR